VLFYDSEQKTVEPVANDWRIVSFVRAARKFPELRSLLPVRPEDAVTCPKCGGTGFRFEKFGCGECRETGWVLPSGLSTPRDYS
jgi:hypothetical protein